MGDAPGSNSWPARFWSSTSGVKSPMNNAPFFLPNLGQASIPRVEILESHCHVRKQLQSQEVLCNFRRITIRGSKRSVVVESLASYRGGTASVVLLSRDIQIKAIRIRDMDSPWWVRILSWAEAGI